MLQQKHMLQAYAAASARPLQCSGLPNLHSNCNMGMSLLRPASPALELQHGHVPAAACLTCTRTATHRHRRQQAVYQHIDQGNSINKH
jgi:hypothetical protein